MRGLLARAVRTAPSEAAAFLLRDPAGHELVFRASRTIQSGVIDGMRLPVNRGIAGLTTPYTLLVNPDCVVPGPTVAGLLAHLDAQGGRPDGARGTALDRNVRLFHAPPRGSPCPRWRATRCFSAASS